MKTRREVDVLKAAWAKEAWDKDPSWNLYEMADTEKYRDELRAFQTEMGMNRQIRQNAEVAKFASDIGVSPNLAKYIKSLEDRVSLVEELESRISYLESRLPE